MWIEGSELSMSNRTEMTGIELKEAKEELEFVIDRFYDFPEETNVTNSINNVQNAVKAINELEDYYAIGTVEECREAIERQMAKKPIPIDYKKIYEYSKKCNIFKRCFLVPEL